MHILYRYTHRNCNEVIRIEVIESLELNLSDELSASSCSSVRSKQLLMSESNIQYRNCGDEYVVTVLNAEINQQQQQIMCKVFRSPYSFDSNERASKSERASEKIERNNESTT